MSRRAAIPASFYKVLVFVVVTSTLIGVLATLVGNISLAPSRSFHALFTDATGVSVGDRVRLAGVEVGSVQALQLVEVDGRRVAQVTFSVDDGTPVYRSAQLILRYENIVGQRYLAIAEKPTAPTPMPAGGTFPLDQTTPALDLTQLFNGFQPLFTALSPQDMNAFSYELVRALQGESGSIAAVMGDTATLTNTLANRDRVIGRVVSNLNAVLSTVGTRDSQLTSLIVQFRNLMHGLAQHRDTIDRSLPALAGLIEDTGSFVGRIRPALQIDVTALDAIARQVDHDKGTLDASLRGLPAIQRQLIRTASYGSWFNFYVCGLSLRLSLAGGAVNLGGVGVASNERDTVCGKGVTQ